MTATSTEGDGFGDGRGRYAGTSPARGVARVRAWLAEVDVATLGDRERVALVAELERLKGAASSTQVRATDAYRESRHERAPRDASRSVGAEIGLARRESPTMGDRFVGVSRALVHEMPYTMAALADGTIGERHAVEMVKETAALTREDRGVVDGRLAKVITRLGPRAAGRAARRAAAELDAASVVARMERAVRSRRVSVRPAPDGMAYLTVLAPMRECVGAYAALRKHATAVIAGQCPDEEPDGRGAGAVMADTAARLLAGLAPGQVAPVEVHLVMTDRSLLGTGDPHRPVNEPARVPGHGSVPAPVARAWVRDADAGSVWLRRLYTSPDGRDLVAMDARGRTFRGLLRRMLVLRDDVCATPWCDAPIVHADHTRPAREGGPTSYHNGSGTCARCNQTKEAPGWLVEVVHRGPGIRGGPPRDVRVTTPTHHAYRSQAPPLLGWGGPEPSSSASLLERHLAALLADAA